MYFYRTYTAMVSGSTTRRERCAGCSRVFEYTIRRDASGGGHSAYLLNNAGASASADARARTNLSRALKDAIEPVHCPACGIYQPDMVRVLRERNEKHYQPNKFASERIAIPVEQAWATANAANTKDSYSKFKEVWPTYDWYAEKEIKELQYPTHLRKFVSRVGWIIWGALVLGITSLIIMNSL